ncbi:Flp pilus assembly protein CpaB [Arthrobacter yangruifuii]|uniref:Flp pilus assembly protein CpaB n=1 Tax=Arthrobacter yangruifuii TaxID=2606616 RepID=UPI0011B79EEC|nr:SAF domain-containing protein [Arthrobacter yangruifuii]
MPFRRFTARRLSSAARLHRSSGSADPAARVRRFIVRHRRLLAALACCAAAGSAVEALVPVAAERSVVVRAARDLAAGTVLTAASLETARLPAEAVPPGARDDPEALVGRRLATPLLRGSPVTEVSLAGAGLLIGSPPGSVAVPLRPADPSVLDLLGPGQLVSVVAGTEGPWTGSEAGNVPDGGGADVLAVSVPVLWVSGSETAGGWPGTGAGEGLVVVAADPDNAARLTAASGAGVVYLVLTDG